MSNLCCNNTQTGHARRTRFSRICWLSLCLGAALPAMRAVAADLTPAKLLEQARALGGDNPRLFSGQADILEELKIGPPKGAQHKSEGSAAPAPPKEPDEPREPGKKPAKRKRKKSTKKAKADDEHVSHFFRTHRILFAGSGGSELLRESLDIGLNATDKMQLFSVEVSGGPTGSGAKLGVIKQRATITQRYGDNLLRNLGRVGASKEVVPAFVRSLAQQGEKVEQLPDETVDGQKCKVLKVSNAFTGTLQQQLWIDTERGYICPRQYSFNGQGKLSMIHEASEYFQEPTTKIWFPGREASTTFDQLGQQSQQSIYKIKPESLRVNQSVPLKEFAVTLAPQSVIDDKRSGGREWRVDREVQLAFQDGVLNLEHVEGLTATTEPRGVPFSSFRPEAFSKTARVILLVAACIPPLALIFTIWLVRRLLARPKVIVATLVKTPD